MMKKLLTILLTVLLITPAIGVISRVEVKADSYGPYYVEYIEDDGHFTQIEEYSDLRDALNKMKENEDYVVRHDLSLSPMKIIAMNSGMAISYPYRGGSSTQYLYEKINENLAGSGATSYVSGYYEMTYHETYHFQVSSYRGYGIGYAKVTLNGFTGYADLECVDLIPSKFINNGLTVQIGGHDRTGGGRSVKTLVIEPNYYFAKRNGNYTDLVFAMHEHLPNSEGRSFKYELAIGPAPSFMEEGKKYYSNDGINFFSDLKLKNLVGINYNYYQFLPLRSYSNISADKLDEYLDEKAADDSILKDHGSDFINNQNKYGVNGVTILSMAIHESGWGTSTIAKTKNNLYGWGAYDDNTSAAKAYPSVSDSVAAQMGDNLANYLDQSSGKYYWTMSLGNKGGGFVLKYASDPYWAEKISKYYYDIDKFANDYNGHLTDYNAYTLALINKVGAEVKRSASNSSETLYTTQNKSTGYQKNLIAIILDDSNGFSKTQLSNAIDSDGSVICPISLSAGTLVKYDRDRSVGYISNSYLTILNKNKDLSSEEPTVNPDNFKSIISIDGLSFNGDSLTLEGIAFIKGVSFKTTSNIKHELILTSLKDSSVTKTYTLSSENVSGYNFGDGFTYEKIGFKGTLNLSELSYGEYEMKIKVSVGEYSATITLNSSQSSLSNVNSYNEESFVAYRISPNDRRGYRLELTKASSIINYSKISKPSSRKSMFDLLEDIMLEDATDSAKLTLNATAYIYYLNFDSASNPTYKLLLVNGEDHETNKVYDCSHVELPDGYANAVSKNYNVENIGFVCEAELSDLQDGTYDMVIEVTNGSNKDYVNAIIIGDANLPTITIDSKTYSIKKSINSKLVVEVLTQGENE